MKKVDSDDEPQKVEEVDKNVEVNEDLFGDDLDFGDEMLEEKEVK